MASSVPLISLNFPSASDDCLKWHLHFPPAPEINQTKPKIQFQTPAGHYAFNV